MIAKSLDVYVWLKLCLERDVKTYEQLGEKLGMSASEVHAAVRRGTEAGLVRSESKKVISEAFLDYLIHGVRYAFPAVSGRLARGMPTGFAAPCLAGEFAETELPAVWEHAEGTFADKVSSRCIPLHPRPPRATKISTGCSRWLTPCAAAGPARDRRPQPA